MWIDADFATHEDHDNWSAVVMCLSRAYADRFELRKEMADIRAHGPSFELTGLPIGHFCGVVGMYVPGGDIREDASTDDILQAYV